MLKGVIFDMDGTITVPYIDWRTLRENIGAVPGQTIMDYINSLPPERFEWANRQLLDAELEAATRANANDGIVELVNQFRALGLRLAVVTNNHREAMLRVLERYGLEFDAALAREDGKLKPSPDLIQKALEQMALSPEETISIGDGRYDIEACRLAGVRCIYLTHGAPALDHEPAVATLHDILPLLRTEGLV